MVLITWESKNRTRGISRVVRRKMKRFSINILDSQRKTITRVEKYRRMILLNSNSSLVRGARIRGIRKKRQEKAWEIRFWISHERGIPISLP